MEEYSTSAERQQVTASCFTGAGIGSKVQTVSSQRSRPQLEKRTLRAAPSLGRLKVNDD